MTWITWGWIGFGLYFVVLEGIALFNKQPGDTLSEHIWKWFKSGNQDTTNILKWPFRRYVLVAGLIWLLGHLGFGWWAGA